MKKKLLSALLCVAMVASLVVGCGGKEEGKGKADGCGAPEADRYPDCRNEGSGKKAGVRAGRLPA